MGLELFSVPVFVVVFRETLETAIIVSVLLAFLKQTLDGSQRDPKLYQALRTQVCDIWTLFVVTHLPAANKTRSGWAPPSDSPFASSAPA